MCDSEGDRSDIGLLEGELAGGDRLGGDIFEIEAPGGFDREESVSIKRELKSGRLAAGASDGVSCNDDIVGADVPG